MCFYLDLHGGHIEAPLRHSPLRASFFHFLEYFHSQRLDFESDSFKFYNSVFLRHICVTIFLLLFIIIIACSSLLQAYRMSTRERISERRQCNEDQAQPARLTIRVLLFLFLIVDYLSNQKLKQIGRRCHCQRRPSSAQHFGSR